jgi:hypothetical protein
METYNIKYAPLRIWGIAQIIHALFCLAFGELGVFIIFFALLGGLPAIPIYYLLMLLARTAPSKAWTTILMLLLLPACTVLCGYVTIRMMDSGWEDGLEVFLIAPAAATILAVLIDRYSVLKPKKSKQ